MESAFTDVPSMGALVMVFTGVHAQKITVVSKQEPVVGIMKKETKVIIE